MTQRYEGVDPDAMSDEQRAVAERIGKGPRGKLGPLMTFWLHSPDMAAQAEQLGAFLRFGTSLSPKAAEMVILITARHWKSQHEWRVHVEPARRAGLSDAIIEAIRRQEQTSFDAPALAALHRFTVDVLTNFEVSDETFEETRRHFGLKAIVETGSLISHYIHGAITLNVARFGQREGPGAEF